MQGLAEEGDEGKEIFLWTINRAKTRRDHVTWVYCNNLQKGEMKERNFFSGL